MHPSRLLLCILITTAVLADMAEAQPCYKKTDEFVVGNFFVKPMSDSTCFGQWYDELRYFNFKTGATLYSFLTEQYYPHPHFGVASVTDILMFDSLLVVSWEYSDVYRILKVDYLGIVSEIPTALDSIPLLKIAKDVGALRGRKLNAVNDGVFLMSSVRTIYSFLRSGVTVTCVDSMSLPTLWPEADGTKDMYGDTIVLLSTEDHEARFYHVDSVGQITYSTTVGLDRDSWPTDVCIRYGKLYVKDGALWRTLVRTPEGFKLTPGSSERPIVGMWQPLFGNENVMIVGEYDEIRVYDKEFTLLCHKAPLVSLQVMASGIYGNKVFLATSAGITTWLPDTNTTSITSPPLANRPSGIEVWPNPSAGGTITVRSEEPAAAIELTDVTGRVVFRTSQPGVGATVIPTAFLPAGMYIVNVQTAGGILRERVVILGMGD